MFGWIRSMFRRPRRYIRRALRAHDAAETTDNNRRHWANANSLSADALATPARRQLLRNRARYEVANNAYARGIVNTYASDVIGTGPRLQMMTDDPDLNSCIERDFMEWSDAVRLASKLRTGLKATTVDGEMFGLMFTNPKLLHAVQLDLRLLEADHVTAPNFQRWDDPNYVDGIAFDTYGNPVEYHVLKQHPGSSTAGLRLGEYTRYPARDMLHYFHADRPGQRRGVPDIGASLELFAQLRRYTLAVLSSAETAANISGVIKTDAPAGTEEEDGSGVEPMDTVDIDRNSLMTLPDGYEMQQFRAEQPTTTYQEFKHEILNEAARSIGMPFNIAAGNSAGYNYASGRLDHQTYYKSIRVEQAGLVCDVVDRIFEMWLQEYSLATYIPIENFSHQWFWDGTEHVDPMKEAKAQDTRLRNNTTTLAYEYARQGRDWEAELHQRAKEKNLMAKLGLTEADVPEEDDDEDDEEKTENAFAANQSG